MKLVVIESPFAGAYLRNTTYLRSCILDCLRRGESPYASHRMLTDALDDSIPEERQLGIDAGLAWRNALYVDEQGVTQRVLPVFYNDIGVSRGMELAAKKYDGEGRSYEVRQLLADDPFWLRYPYQGVRGS